MTAPLLSLFLRIRITMYYDDHNPLTFMRNTREHKDGTTEGRPALQSSRKWRNRGLGEVCRIVRVPNPTKLTEAPEKGPSDEVCRARKRPSATPKGAQTA